MLKPSYYNSYNGENNILNGYSNASVYHGDNNYGYDFYLPTYHNSRSWIKNCVFENFYISQYNLYFYFNGLAILIVVHFFCLKIN